MTARPLRLAVLISGRGSNLKAILEAIGAGRLAAQVVLVISNRPGAAGLDIAAAAAVPTAVIDHRQYPDRPAFEQALGSALDAAQAELVVLAGFMRVLTADFVHRYRGRLINIHPSLLPAFAGLDTHARALAAGATEHGASVHFVTAAVDGGPLIAQIRVPVQAGDTPDTLAARVLPAEHRLYPRVIGWYAAGRLVLGEDTVRLDGLPLAAPVQFTATGGLDE
ncbi:MAG: phosphoribosylglycinamide formyltransferase [Immundisolibacter sp.]|uniref:phosphoribosylglycinamide formyltransferase n=1 Tax=Immundisolibacter sp. TaxID=1934948 RepID=UPI00199B987F|nr:phosphoribosylglycinamide formyltransferase [Immundisolibacter sp.]MBC7160583.1 phosphoribosylglycinamide formyltransferase [Immundisolibacter sp.]